MIREATIDDLNRIVEITNACGKHMISQNIFQWNEDYPNIEIFKKDLEKQSLYVIELESKIVGCVCISEKMDAVYKKVKWLTPDTKNMYVHRLAIDPKYQGKGLAIKLIFRISLKISILLLQFKIYLIKVSIFLFYNIILYLFNGNDLYVHLHTFKKLH